MALRHESTEYGYRASKHLQGLTVSVLVKVQTTKKDENKKLISLPRYLIKPSMRRHAVEYGTLKYSSNLSL